MSNPARPNALAVARAEISDIPLIDAPEHGYSPVTDSDLVEVEGSGKTAGATGALRAFKRDFMLTNDARLHLQVSWDSKGLTFRWWTSGSLPLGHQWLALTRKGDPNVLFWLDLGAPRTRQQTFFVPSAAIGVDIFAEHLWVSISLEAHVP